MTTRTSTLERIGFWAIVASLGLVQVKLMAAQICFGVAAIVWLIVAVREGRRPAAPAFFVPLLAYCTLTLASAAASIDPLRSFIDCKQLVLFLMVPIVMRFARGPRALVAINVIMAVGAAMALVGIVEAALLGFDTLNHRPGGFFTHYMTYSGVLMLVACAAAARLMFYPSQIIWPAIAVPALLVALVATQTRNAWIGTFAGVGVLLAIRRARLLLILPVVIMLFVLFAPAHIKQRASSAFDPNEDSNRDRLQMVAMGADIVRDHPVFGVGPEMIGSVYGQYLRPNPVHTYNPHLHDVPVQIAAERGLPALAVWLWFIVIATRDLWRQLRSGPAKALAGAGLAAIVAMIVAGFFEYNFGDSEFLMLFLGLITLPFAARLNGDPSVGVRDPKAPHEPAPVLATHAKPATEERR